MTKEQMEMLSVKNAIERMVHNLISTFQQNQGSFDDFILMVERTFASFFVGQQVDKINHWYDASNIYVTFETRGQKTNITFMLPPKFLVKEERESALTKAARKVETQENTVSKVWNGKEWVGFDGKPVKESIYRKKESEVKYLSDEAKTELKPTVVDAYEKAKKHVEGMSGLQTYADGDWQA